MFKEQCDLYHFSETVNEKDIDFDYKLRAGISNTTNAILLLKQVGFPKEIIEVASQIQ